MHSAITDIMCVLLLPRQCGYMLITLVFHLAVPTARCQWNTNLSH